MVGPNTPCNTADNAPRHTTPHHARKRACARARAVEHSPVSLKSTNFGRFGNETGHPLLPKTTQPVERRKQQLAAQQADWHHASSRLASRIKQTCIKPECHLSRRSCSPAGLQKSRERVIVCKALVTPLLHQVSGAFRFIIAVAGAMEVERGRGRQNAACKEPWSEPGQDSYTDESNTPRLGSVCNTPRLGSVCNTYCGVVDHCIFSEDGLEKLEHTHGGGRGLKFADTMTQLATRRPRDTARRTHTLHTARTIHHATAPVHTTCCIHAPPSSLYPLRWRSGTCAIAQ